MARGKYERKAWMRNGGMSTQMKEAIQRALRLNVAVSVIAQIFSVSESTIKRQKIPKVDA